jgi:hypothetical protein
MTIVINVAAIVPKIKTLGWENVNLIEAMSELTKANVPGPAVIAYLDALIANETGMDDTTITGCDSATAAKITGWLREKGLVSS